MLTQKQIEARLQEDKRKLDYLLYLASGGTPGTGTVTSVSLVAANGFTGTVANSTSSPDITIATSITGILKGNGTAISAAIAGDFPTLNQNTTGSAASLSTNLPVAKLDSGTNASTTTFWNGGGSWESINLVVTPAGTGEAVLFDLGTDILYHKAIGDSTFINAATASDTITLSLSATGTPDNTTFLRGDNTWATPSGSGAKTFSISGSGANNSTMTDGATQYIGSFALGQTSAATNHPIYIDRTCTLKSIVLNSFAGTAGTNENWLMYVRVNNTTDYLIEDLASSSANRVWNNDALNISLSAGDVIIIKNVQPTWATNPASVAFSFYMVFEY